MKPTLSDRIADLRRIALTINRKLDALLRSQNLEIIMEYSQMADFTALVEKVEKIRGAAASTNAFVAGLKQQLADLAAGMNDEEDQAKVVALSADLDAISESLPKAVAENPVP